jgi:ribonuclease-3
LPSNASVDNEQFEFLGDSILGFVVSEALIAKNPSAQEGQLSQWKAQLVSAAHLYQCALALDLGTFLILGKGEEKNGGRERRALLADAMEAIIAAIHLDGGLEPARAFVYGHILKPFEDSAEMGFPGLSNYKSALQEKLQAMGLPPPRYTIIETSGPEHAKMFTVEATVGDRFIGRASGTSKKTASQNAAHEVMEQLAHAEPAEQGAYQNSKHVS